MRCCWPGTKRHLGVTMRFLIVLALAVLGLADQTTMGAVSESALLGVGILSKSTNWDRRATVRGSWMTYDNVKNGTAQAVFIVGLPNDPAVKRQLDEEKAKYNDIVFTDTNEGWDRLTYQSLAIHEYFQNTARWIAKTDDDTLVRVDLLCDYLRTDPKVSEADTSVEAVAVGWTVDGAPVHRVGKYALTEEEFADETLPLYVSGPAYMVSAAISKAIVKESMNYGLPMLKLEDIALALWIDFLMKERNLNVRFVDQRKFYKIRTCAESAFTVLLEEGRPLKLGPEGVAKVMHEIVANDKNNRQPACPYESTLEWIQERNEREKAGEVDPQPKQKKQPAPAPVPLTPIPAEAPVPAQKNVRSTSVKVVLYDDPRGYHPELSPGLYECAGLDSCSYRITQDPEDIANANGVVFLGDKEIYGHSGDRVLPTKPQGVPFGYVFREAESKFPAPANKYDFKVTYALDSAAVYPYISDVDRLIAAAQGALSKPKDPDVAPVAFVGLRCGDRPSDPRTERAEIVRRIGTQVGVDSYGVCLNNRTWPDGHVKDKSYVMQTHKFCIAIENSFDFDYVTEKVFDCLAAGSVPIYKGPPNAGRFFPQDAAIWVDEFDSPEDVGRYVAKVAADDKLYEEYRAWIHDPPAEWLAFVRGIQSAKLPCRLCETLA